MKKISGFTLIELIAVMSIVIILASVAVPSFDDTIKRRRLSSATTDLLGEFEYARSESVKRNLPVTICATTDNSTCDSENWEDGRLVFIDDGAGTEDDRGNGVVNGEEVLKIFGSAPHAVTIRSTIFAESGYVVFNEDGSVEDVGTMVMCDGREGGSSDYAKAINLSIIGQSRKAYDSDEDPDGTVNDIAGVNVECL